MAKKLFITKKFKIFYKLLDSPLTGAIIIHLQGEKNVKNMTFDQMHDHCTKLFPTLKRWKNSK